jgi:hypothetical protein
MRYFYLEIVAKDVFYAVGWAMTPVVEGYVQI